MNPILLLNRTEIKEGAKALLKSAKVPPIRMTLLLLIITQLLNLANGFAGGFAWAQQADGKPFLPFLFLTIILSLMGLILSAGYNCYCLGIQAGKEMPYSTLFEGFAFAGKFIGLMLMESLFVALWAMLFIFPGFVAAYRYSFAVWNLCRNPNLGIMEALSMSVQQTRGYKMQLFELHLSFLPLLLPVAVLETLFEAYVLPMVSGMALSLLAQFGLSLLVGVFMLYIMPYLTLSVCGFFLRATAPRNEEKPPLPNF